MAVRAGGGGDGSFLTGYTAPHAAIQYFNQLWYPTTDMYINV